jgi:hypothetical protein
VAGDFLADAFLAAFSAVGLVALIFFFVDFFATAFFAAAFFFVGVFFAAVFFLTVFAASSGDFAAALPAVFLVVLAIWYLPALTALLVPVWNRARIAPFRRILI